MKRIASDTIREMLKLLRLPPDSYVYDTIVVYRKMRLSHIRHSEPFNKREGGKLRRAQRRFKIAQRGL